VCTPFKVCFGLCVYCFVCLFCDVRSLCFCVLCDLRLTGCLFFAINRSHNFFFTNCFVLFRHLSVCYVCRPLLSHPVNHLVNRCFDTWGLSQLCPLLSTVISGP
jgi:hypothetical protein